METEATQEESKGKSECFDSESGIKVVYKVEPESEDEDVMLIVPKTTIEYDPEKAPFICKTEYEQIETKTTKSKPKKTKKKSIKPIKPAKPQKKCARKKKRTVLRACSICGLVSKTQQQLDKHEEKCKTIEYVGQTSYECYLCKKTWKRVSNYDDFLSHMKVVHTTVGKFRCLHCDKRFGMQKNLDAHNIRLHLGGAKFKCSNCGQKSVDDKTYQGHLKRCRRTYECYLCKQSLKVKSRLRSHFRRNHLAYNQCPNCKKIFVRGSILEQHLNRLASDKAIECFKCGGKFCDKQMFKVHISQCDKKKLIKCSLCKFTSYWPSRAKRHIDIKHPIEYRKPDKVGFFSNSESKEIILFGNKNKK